MIVLIFQTVIVFDHVIYCFISQWFVYKKREAVENGRVYQNEEERERERGGPPSISPESAISAPRFGLIAI